LRRIDVSNCLCVFEFNTGDEAEAMLAASIPDKESREAEITKLQDHFYRVKSKLRSCKREEFSQRAARVDGHLLAAFQELSDVQDIADTTVAHRYRDDPKRQQRPQPKRAKPAATGGGPASHTSRYSVIHISDSEELEELLNGGASSTD